MQYRPDPDPKLLRTAAIGAVLGSAALLISNIWGSIVVPNHDFIADTVSDLAAGQYEYIQDIGLYGYALGLLGLSIALADLRLGHGRWSIGVTALAVTVLLVTIIAARNEYGDNDQEGVEVHIYLVYAMGLTFTAAFTCLAEGFDAIAPRFRAASYALAVLWAIGAVVFFILPTAYDGIWERGLGLITIAWCLMAARVLWRAAA